ncbi:MAG: hypothetical protein R2779_11655 [Crocinitomicaceae bacterium]
MKTLIVCLAIFCLSTVELVAQISPPGLGRATAASWFALGISQKLDTIEGKGWQSMSYIGLGRISNPDNYAIFKNKLCWW